MRVLFFVTHTPNCEPFWRSLEAIGHEVKVQQYDDRPHDRHPEFVDLALAVCPDFMVVIGAYEPSHGRPVIRPCIFRDLKSVAPLIFLCGDAADDPWWPVLNQYAVEDCFSAMVAIDGASSPIDRFPHGLTLLTPLDPRPFARSYSWVERPIRLGMIGGTGHRANLIRDLQKRGLLDYCPGPIGRSYEAYAEMMCNTRITLNLAQTGTGRFLHVKGRVCESGFAGSVVLETKGSPLRNWFTPGVDYLEYEGVEDLISTLTRHDDAQLSRMAIRFHQKMATEHHPTVFWDKVLRKAGVRQ